jgi:hypothetical protein
MAKPTTSDPATDRVEIAGGGTCPRCREPMQRFERPEGYKPSNVAPFACVQRWDRCGCGWIQRLEERVP